MRPEDWDHTKRNYLQVLYDTESQAEIGEAMGLSPDRSTLKSSESHHPQHKGHNLRHLGLLPEDILVTSIENGEPEIRIISERENIATPEDIAKRMHEQDIRIAKIPYAKRSPVERKYLKHRQQ